jgi:RNase P subunit RPR2
MDDQRTVATLQLDANLSVAHIICYATYIIQCSYDMKHFGCTQDVGGCRDSKNLLIAIDFRLYRRNSLDIFHHNKENVCDQCGEKFVNHEELISHARHVHHYTIVKCHECGKEFIHEKDRLHHVREEHKKKAESREQKNLHNTK